MELLKEVSSNPSLDNLQQIPLFRFEIVVKLVINLLLLMPFSSEEIVGMDDKKVFPRVPISLTTVKSFLNPDRECNKIFTLPYLHLDLHQTEISSL